LMILEVFSNLNDSMSLTQNSLTSFSSVACTTCEITKQICPNSVALPGSGCKCVPTQENFKYLSGVIFREYSSTNLLRIWLL